MKIRKSILITAIALALVGSCVYGVSRPEAVIECGTLQGSGKVKVIVSDVAYVVLIDCGTHI